MSKLWKTWNGQCDPPLDGHVEKPLHLTQMLRPLESWTWEALSMAKPWANTPYAAQGRLVQAFMTLQKGRQELALLSTPPERGMAAQSQLC